MTVNADMNDDYKSLCHYIDELPAAKAIQEVRKHLSIMQNFVHDANARSRHSSPDLSGFERALELIRAGKTAAAKQYIYNSIVEYYKFVDGIPRQFR